MKTEDTEALGRQRAKPPDVTALHAEMTGNEPAREREREREERIVLREIHLRTTGRHLSMGSQCYLPPDRGDRPAFTPTEQVGIRIIDPVRMKA